MELILLISFIHYILNISRIFFVDTINFSFLSEEGEKFEVTYKNQTYTGYFAACACVKRALDHGIPLLKADFMENITEDDIANIFRGDKGIFNKF